jgi:hypothetical protein
MIMRLILINIALLLLSCSCKEKVFTGNVNCDECYTDKPKEADLIIDLTINNRYHSVPIVVYKGDIEDNRIVAIDTADTTPFFVYVEVDEKYSVKAEYKKNDVTLFTVDGTKLKVKLVSDACDAECYVIEGEALDARIKKDFLDF